MEGALEQKDSVTNIVSLYFHSALAWADRQQECVHPYRGDVVLTMRIKNLEHKPLRAEVIQIGNQSGSLVEVDLKWSQGTNRLTLAYP
jgi:hypothetical protein